MRRLVKLGCALLVLATTHAAAQEIPVISLDRRGRERVVSVPRDKYTKGMTAMYSGLQDEAVPSLSKASQGRQWRLRTVVIGIGLNAEVGFPPFFSLGIAPRFRAEFSNSTQPVIP